MDADLLAQYDGLRVPRYTSYPTAPHFTPTVDAGRYREWLACLPSEAPLSLYLHLPFCESMCWYCGCNTRVVARYEPIAAYMESLNREIDMIADLLPQRMTVRHLHWGGGTPTMASSKDLRAAMDHLRARFDFAPDSERAIEIDPRTLTSEMVVALAESGVNRASLGVQDINEDVQNAVNRIQPLDVTASAVNSLRAVGMTAVNFDLMYGLPQQTVEHCRATAAAAADLRPDRLAVFGYAHVPWMKKHQKLINESALPDGPERWRQFAAIAEVLTAAGYEMIGLDHFAKPDDPLAVAQRAGKLRRNFQGYTDDDAGVLIGLGASAIGALPQGYVQNAVGTNDYTQAIAENRLPIARGLLLSDDDRMRRDVIIELMCALTVDLEDVARRHHCPDSVFDADLPGLDRMVKDGLATIDGRRITVPPAARPLVRIAAAVFDRYLTTNADKPRHSRAI
ncbi:Oxygen-independent coproporphyrinogen III oxidase [Azospirillaceae bacterium]